ncbi:DEAD-box ATP-dependent RNA helicase 24-like protein [Babesia ovata]|uniref:RNA helicase n=1 Tax=Babesia ovata TaxID=189622 RepID=A0A2H6KEM8_9APIC|nr:DEAD-box ATP-dependent RNA helicase 24-like protein [Babesia ovata]GBE61451.1 DEAD-box ATP-dependent RNA helicase 24-like protein [Babesia ovata]
MTDDSYKSIQNNVGLKEGTDSETLEAFFKALEECENDLEEDSSNVIGDSAVTLVHEEGSNNGDQFAHQKVLSQHPEASGKPNGQSQILQSAHPYNVATRVYNHNPRDIYKVDADVDALTLLEVVNLKKRLGIETMGVRVPKPIGSFSHLTATVAMPILKRLNKLGYSEPTPMQCQAMPILLQGRSAILMGESGCGKSLSYILPLICHILCFIRESQTVAPKRSAFCIIMALTREVSNNILTMLSKLMKSLVVRIAMITSGYDNYSQIVSGTEFLVVTPAKLGDLINQRCLTLDATNYIVVEGFEKMYHKHPTEVEALLSHRCAIKVVLSNAILGVKTLTALRQYLKGAITVKYIVKKALSGTNLKWIACLKEPSHVQKATFIANLLSHFHQSFRMIVFANERISVENICSYIQNITENVGFVHDAVGKDITAETLRLFREGKLHVLVTTETTLGNANLPKVDYVVIYDMPRTLNRFCWRVGVASASEKSVVYSLLTKHDHIICAHICNQLSDEGLELPRVLDQVAVNWKPYRHSRRHRKDSRGQESEHKEVEIAMRGTTQLGRDSENPAYDDLISTRRGNVTKATEPEGIQLRFETHESSEQTQNYNCEVHDGRSYDAADELPSDDDVDAPPKRQLAYASGLINLEKLKQRRLRMMGEQHEM